MDDLVTLGFLQVRFSAVGEISSNPVGAAPRGEALMVNARHWAALCHATLGSIALSAEARPISIDLATVFRTHFQAATRSADS
jgi:hypothetical protein